MAYYSKSNRLEEVIAGDIRSGKFSTEAYFPSEQRLVELYDSSRQTIRRVLSALEQQGLLIRHENRRLSVAPRTQLAPAPVVSRNDKFNIALVWAAYPDTLTSEFTEGVGNYVNESGLNLQLHASITGHESVLSFLNHARELGIDGLIVMPYEDEQYQQALTRLLADRMPIVTMHRLSGIDCCSIGGNDSHGIFIATSRMIARSNRPAHFLGVVGECDSVNMRYAGYRQAMYDAGFGELIDEYTILMPPCRNDPVYWPMNAKWKLPAEVAQKFLAQAELPVGIICQNDYAAQGVYHAAEALHLQIGRDVLVTGFDDIPLASRLQPPLTTIRVPVKESGYKAAELLHRLLRREVNGTINLELPVEFIERESM